MIRNLKALGLMLVAALAMSAMAASAAQATEGVFTAGLTKNALGEIEHTTTTFTGSQVAGKTNKFSGDGIPVECSIATYSGTVGGGTSTEITATPNYKDCTASGTLPATVTVTGCAFLFTRPSPLGTKDEEWTSKVKVECSGSSSIEIHVYLGGTVTAHNTKLCTLTIEPNLEYEHAILTNGVTAGGKDDVTVNATATGIKYTETGAGCPHPGTTRADGIFESTVTVEGTGGDEIWISTANAKSP